jgi:alpha-beta hydrolase superfamily lysophospholipase
MTLPASERGAIPTAGGVGLADDYWKKYYAKDYSDADVHEIVQNSSTTMFESGGLPIHVRIYRQGHPAPTVVMSHGLLPYGLIMAGCQLPFFRAGFNVVVWDLPGFGQSGGPRAGCTIPEVIQTWKDALDFAQREFEPPYYTVGVAEDGVTCYYAAANDPRIAAMSLHILAEYGDPDNVHWLGSAWWIKVQSLFVRLAARIVPSYPIDAKKGVPWDGVFGRLEDSHFRQVFENDPLRLQHYELRLAASMMGRIMPAVPFEQCKTPIQIIASDRNKIWPYRMAVKYYNRLGGPKELVTLKGKVHWQFQRDFEETFCNHALAWFAAQGAQVTPR